MALLLTVECSWQRKPCQCRRVRELHFADIVDVQQLLEVMAHDAAPVAERTQRLLLPSYFPGNGEARHTVATWTCARPPRGMDLPL